MRKVNVALFINSLCGGGAERVVSRISKELDKEYELYIFLIEGKKRFYECTGTIVDLGCGSERYIVNAVCAVANINKTIKKYDINCVISFLDMPNIINCLICRNVKKIASIRDYSSVELCKTWKEKIKFICLRDNLKRADKIIFVSDELNSEIVKAFGIEETKASTIENPYDIAAIDSLAEQEIDERVYSFIQENKTAVAVGRLDEQKGYHELLDIFEEVYKNDSRAALIILGEGALKNDLEEWIKTRQLEDRIMLLGLCKNPFAYMSKCKVYVSCSLHEGFPNALVEAMACGLPVIHTDCKTGPREIITGERMESDIKSALYSLYGILVPSYTRKQVSIEDTRKEFVQAWLRLLDSEELCAQYRQASKERAGYYSMDKCRKKFQEVIKDVLQCAN